MLGLLLLFFALATHETNNVRRKAVVHVKSPEKNPALGVKRGRFKEARGLLHKAYAPNSKGFHGKAKTPLRPERGSLIDIERGIEVFKLRKNNSAA